MMRAEQERLAPLGPASPVPDHEGERRPALLETAVFERAELEQPGQRQHARRDQPAIEGQPRAVSRQSVQSAVRQMRQQPEAAPDREVAGDHQPQQHAPDRAGRR